jgi:hypothetical protein
MTEVPFTVHTFLLVQSLCTEEGTLQATMVPRAVRDCEVKGAVPKSSPRAAEEQDTSIRLGIPR